MYSVAFEPRAIRQVIPDRRHPLRCQHHAQDATLVRSAPLASERDLLSGPGLHRECVTVRLDRYSSHFIRAEDFGFELCEALQRCIMRMAEAISETTADHCNTRGDRCKERRCAGRSRSMMGYLQYVGSKAPALLKQHVFSGCLDISCEEERSLSELNPQ